MPVTERGRVAAQVHRQAGTPAKRTPSTDAAPIDWGDLKRAARYAQKARSAPKVLRASGARIDSSSPELLRQVTLGRRSQAWQELAWGYRDMIGELRYALQFRARAISRVRFFAAEIVSDDDEPIPLSLRLDKDAERRARVTLPPGLCDAAEAELARLPLDAGFGFLGIWSENFDVAGECYLHGYYDPQTGEEEWKIRSVDEVDFSSDGRTVHLRDETLPGGLGRKLDLDNEELYRLWVPHPRRQMLADSALHAMVSVMEDICLIGRESRAVRRSRIMSNGVVLIPDGMTVMRNVREDADVDPEDEPFMAQFTEAMNAPISNEGDPGGTVPIGLTGDIEDIKAFRHVKFERTGSETLAEDLVAGLGRLANGLDIPPELLQGMGEVNHWTAWQIDSSTARHHIEPGVRLMVDSLTTAYLRSALLKGGHPVEQVRRVRVWYDMGSLTENPNRRQDAIDARKEGAIGNGAFRKALGFNDGDAPTPQEVIEMVALKSGFDQATATAVLQYISAGDPDQPFNFPVPQARSALPASAPAAPDPAPVGPGDPAGQAPSTAPSAVAASGRRGSALTAVPAGHPLSGDLSGRELSTVHTGLTAAAAEADARYQLVFDQTRALVDVERTLRSDLLVACDAAMTRALEIAGARLRAKATANPKLHESLRGKHVLVLGQIVGREAAFAINANEEHLLRDAFANLATLFTKWVLLGIENVVERVLEILGLDAESRAGRAAAKRMREDMSSRIDDGWNRLHDSLVDRAGTLLFDGDDEDEVPGEDALGTVPPYMVRTALAIVGGLPETSGGLDEYGRSVTGEPVGGLANGDTVRRAMEENGAVELGYLWVYGITLQPRKFEPHWDLEGVKFTDWNAPVLETADKYAGKYAWVGTHFRPGDHRGCMCDYVPAYAVAEYGDQVRDRLAVPSQAMQDIIDLANGDDAAGRTGTTAQELRAQHQQIQTLQARFLEGKP